MRSASAVLAASLLLACSAGPGEVATYRITYQAVGRTCDGSPPAEVRASVSGDVVELTYKQGRCELRREGSVFIGPCSNPCPTGYTTIALDQVGERLAGTLRAACDDACSEHYELSGERL